MTDPTRRRLLGSMMLTPVALAAPAAAAPGEAAGGLLDGERAGLTGGSPRDQSAAFRRAIEQAAAMNVPLLLPGGEVFIRDLRITGEVRIIGRPGSRLVCVPGGDFLLAVEKGPFEMTSVSVDGSGAIGKDEHGGLVSARGCPSLRIRDCAFSGGAGNGLYMEGCSGVVENNRFSGHGRAAVFSHDGLGMRIFANRIGDCGNNGILVWQSRKRNDGALVSANIISRIRADDGGDGPNGNGINVFRAGNVKVVDNTIRDCAYSAVRDNSGDDVIISRNDCADIGEVAIFVEFAFTGAVVSGNLVRRASAGISLTNLDHGGRLGAVTGNIIRDVKRRIRSEDVLGYGIWAEAETSISGNVVEDAETAGLWLGWGKHLRNVTASGNILRRCRTGIAVSFARGAGTAVITGNLMEKSTRAAIRGFDHARPVTGELAAAAQVPQRLVISANKVK